MFFEGGTYPINYITINGERIAYVEANPEKSNIIFFVHGNSGSWRSWRKQLEDPGLSRFRLVALDLLYHGGSSAPDAGPEFVSVTGMAKIIGEAVNQLAGISKHLIVGLSLGSNIVAEALPYIHPAGIALTSPSVIGRGFEIDKLFQPNADLAAFFSEGLPDNKIEFTLMNCLLDKSESIRQDILNDYHNVAGNWTFRSH